MLTTESGPGYTAAMRGPRDYSAGTKAALAALSRGTCYYPGCPQPVIRFVEGEPYIDYQIAHIRDARSGNRFDPAMTDDERRAFSNLILLCKPHHDFVDKRHPDRFDTPTLREWKRKREAVAASNGALNDIDEDQLESALRTAAIEVVVHGDLHVGGMGGNALGAGGGGGGVIGLGRGGPGGDGSPLVLRDDQRLNLDGRGGAAPGAGGGGGGVVVPGSILRHAASGSHLGQGFSQGVDGGDGGDTTFGGMTARGGRGGLAGTGQRVVGGNITVSSLMLVNYVETREGLAFVAGGGWISCNVPNLPHAMPLALVIQFEAGDTDPGEYTVSVVIRDPFGLEKSRVSFPVTISGRGDLVRIMRPLAVQVCFDSFGAWTVLVEREGRTLASLPICIRRTGES